MDKPVPEETRKATAGLVAEIGEAATIKKLRISRNALGRLLAGLPVKNSTAELASMAFEKPEPTP